MSRHVIDEKEGWAIVYKVAPHWSVGWRDMYHSRKAAEEELDRLAKIEDAANSENRWRQSVMIVPATKTVAVTVEPLEAQS